MRTIPDETQINDDALDLETEDDNETEQIRRLHVHLETFDQEQMREALQNFTTYQVSSVHVGESKLY